MVFEASDQTSVNFCRMNRNIMRPSPNIALMAAKPPKPPCWRDFVSHSKCQSENMTESEFTDISKIARSSNESSSDGFLSNKQGKQKRVRARIHRTRSQFTIEEGDLPEETLTVTLAETKPDDLGLGRETAFDERIFQEDNNRKCQTWLQGIEACQPLEDVVRYDTDSSVRGEVKNFVSYRKLTDSDAEEVPMEIPDDTLWYDYTALDTQCDNHSCDSESTLESRPTRRNNLHKSRTHGRVQTPTSTRGQVRRECGRVPDGSHINTG